MQIPGYTDAARCSLGPPEPMPQLARLKKKDGRPPCAVPTHPRASTCPSPGLSNCPSVDSHDPKVSSVYYDPNRAPCGSRICAPGSCCLQQPPAATPFSLGHLW